MVAVYVYVEQEVTNRARTVRVREAEHLSGDISAIPGFPCSARRRRTTVDRSWKRAPVGCTLSHGPWVHALTRVGTFYVDCSYTSSSRVESPLSDTDQWPPTTPVRWLAGRRTNTFSIGTQRKRVSIIRSEDLTTPSPLRRTIKLSAHV
jgi:hypothetical protein